MGNLLDFFQFFWIGWLLSFFESKVTGHVTNIFPWLNIPNVFVCVCDWNFVHQTQNTLRDQMWVINNLWPLECKNSFCRKKIRMMRIYSDGHIFFSDRNWWSWPLAGIIIHVMGFPTDSLSLPHHEYLFFYEFSKMLVIWSYFGHLVI